VSASLAAALVLLLASSLVEQSHAVALAFLGAAAGLASAWRAGGAPAVIQSAIAAAAPCILAGAVGWPDARLIAFPLAAAALECAALSVAVTSRQALAEAWLCVGARPLEVLSRLRPRTRPAVLVGLVLIAPAIVKPNPAAPLGALAGLLGVAIASVTVSILLAMRLFVDSRLVDRPPAEARSPFRLKPYEPPKQPVVYESRPGRRPPPAT
jgi:hypothetical protein